MSSTFDDSESEPSSSTQIVDNKTLFIDKILGEMKSQFNKSETVVKTEEEENSNHQSMVNNKEHNVVTPKSELEQPDLKASETDDEPKTEETDQNEKPRIVVCFKKPTSNDMPSNTQRTSKPVENSSTNRRSLRNKPSGEDNNKNDEGSLKRSTRRRSKDCNESVLQSAIARKEKSYNESNKPQRLTRQLKPTPKILENLALAKQVKSKSNKGSDNESEDRLSSSGMHKKHKHHHHHSKHKKSKRIKGGNGDSEKDSDSEHSSGCYDNSKIKGGKSEEDEGIGFRRSRRISSSRLKDDFATDDLSDPNANANENISTQVNNGGPSHICLCAQETKYYLDVTDEEVTYCGAVDSVSDKIVGCSRVVNTKEAMMLRPSTRIPYAVLCDTHRSRLVRHNCCPSCGVFCTQGQFAQCDNKHQYHRKCQIEECCPHCGSLTSDYDINIRIESARKPIFLSQQKANYVSAKMTFTHSDSDSRIIEHDQEDDGSSHAEEERCVVVASPPLVPVKVFEQLNSSVEYRGEEYCITDLITSVKNNAVDKVATILASKSVDLTTRLPEYNDSTVLHVAAQNGLLSIMHMLVLFGLQIDVFDKDQNTPLMHAIIGKKNESARYLVKSGASIQLKGTDGMTALHLAAKCGNLEACKLLIDTANALGHRDYVNSCDDGGWTPLVWACEHGFANVANHLIRTGADPAISDVEHNVALHWAAFSGSSHIVELLLNKGCDVNAVNAHGDTALHIGARQDMYNCAVILLARGADVTLSNKNNETPLDCVPSNGDCFHLLSLNMTLQVSSEDADAHRVVLTNDISKGKEANPIQCFNNIDTEPTPCDYRYIKRNCITSGDVKIDTKISSVNSCKCEERCVQDHCQCGKSSVRCWYDEDGKLVPEFDFNDIPMIFECNEGCSCNSITCNNRIVQKGLTLRFELFKTVDKGWGVKTLRPIPKGTFVCEYVGEIITDVEADRREDDTFLFDLENRVCKSLNECDSYCIDARFYGNFTRFMNHSCNPNLTSVKVFIEHQDLRFPRIAFFANRDVVSDEELSFDYGDKFWIAKYKSLSCFCGSLDCKYSEETIDSTVQNYQRILEE